VPTNLKGGVRPELIVDAGLEFRGCTTTNFQVLGLKVRNSRLVECCIVFDGGKAQGDSVVLIVLKSSAQGEVVDATICKKHDGESFRSLDRKHGAVPVKIYGPNSVGSGIPDFYVVQ